MKQALQEKFATFVSQYDRDVSLIDSKYEHSLRVAKLAEEIARSLRLTPKEIELAYVIGILHDIGRFYQISVYNNTDDKNIDHGDYGVLVLFEQKLIWDFFPHEEYFDIIAYAIKHHNKKTLFKNSNEKAQLFAKIVRDADKLDLFYIMAYEKMVLWKEGEWVSPKVWEAFMAEQPIDYEATNTLLDQLLLSLAFLYDLNFAFSFAYLQKHEYLIIILRRYERDYNFDFSLVRQKVFTYLNYHSTQNEKFS